MVNIQVIFFYILTRIMSNKALISSDSKHVLSNISDKLFELVDEVFITLKIDLNFSKSEKVADCFLLSNFAQNVSARNYKKYEEMYNLSRMTVDDSKKDYFVFIINEIMAEILMLERKKLKPNISVKYHRNNQNNINDSKFVLSTRKDITVNLVKLNKEFNTKVEKGLIKDIVNKLLLGNSKNSLKHPDQDLEHWVE